MTKPYNTAKCSLTHSQSRACVRRSSYNTNLNLKHTKNKNKSESNYKIVQHSDMLSHAISFAGYFDTHTSARALFFSLSLSHIGIALLDAMKLTPQRTTRCNTLQHTATHCNTLQHAATHCITLQHTATHPTHRHCFTRGYEAQPNDKAVE